jgi:hypothetical protein
MMSNMNIKTPLPIAVPSSSPAVVANWVQQALALFQDLNAIRPQADASAAKLTQDQIKQFSNMLLALSGADPSKSATTGADALGPVNGALGQTIGNLLNGKKSAVGIIGAMLTGILGGAAGAPDVSVLGKVVALSPALFGSGGALLPVFLAIAAWGGLGKLEKWTAANGGKV